MLSILFKVPAQLSMAMVWLPYATLCSPTKINQPAIRYKLPPF